MHKRSLLQFDIKQYMFTFNLKQTSINLLTN